MYWVIHVAHNLVLWQLFEKQGRQVADLKVSVEGTVSTLIKEVQQARIADEKRVRAAATLLSRIVK